MFPDAAFLHHYGANREACLLEVATAACVDIGTAKDLFVILVFGGSINTLKEDYNVPNDMSLPKFAYEFETGVRNYEARFNADSKHCMYGYAARTKKQHSKRRWENLAFALWLQDLEAHCMMSAMEFVRSKGVELSSLIHDGMLVPVSAASLIDCKALEECVRNST
jgi:hypothetical protein